MGSQRTTQHTELARERSAPEGLFREINERIVELGARFGYRDEALLELLCECADGGCTERINVPPEAYEEARSTDGRSVVVDGHEHSGRVVGRGDGYVVVEA